MKQLHKQFKRHKVVITFLGISLFVFILSYLVLPKGEYRDLAYWIKFFIIVCGTSIAFIEFANVPKNELHRKWVMYTLFLFLLALSLVETANEAVAEKETQKELDSLIAVENERADSIISNLRTNLDNLESTGGLVIEMNKNLKVVKDSLALQILTLRDVVKQSEDYVNLKKDEFRAGRPNLTVYSSDTKVNIDNQEKIRDITVRFVNSGNRTAINVKYTARVFLFDIFEKRMAYSNILYKKMGLINLGKMPPVSANGAYRTIRVIPKLEASTFSKGNKEWLVLVRIYYEDSFGWKSSENFLIVGREFNGEKFYIGDESDGHRMGVIREFLRNTKDYYEFFDE